MDSDRRHPPITLSQNEISKDKEVKPEHTERLSVSKQWVLPPRPKPGRKPKALTETAPKRRRGRPLGSKKNINVVDTSPPSSLPISGSASPASPALVASLAPVADNSGSTGEACVLCSKSECMCETIGLKRSLPTLETILNGTPKMDAVLLRRAPQTVSSKKFPRPEPMQPAVPPLECCGFCTDNSTCACAEVACTDPPPPVQSLMFRLPQPPGPLDLSVAKTPLTTSSTPTNSQSPGGARPMYEYNYYPSDEVQSCAACEKDAMSMLFCLSLYSSAALNPGAVSLPCYLAFRTLQKHHKFDGCDLGKLVSRLEVCNKQIGVQSINRVLQDLDRGEFTT